MFICCIAWKISTSMHSWPNLMWMNEFCIYCANVGMERWNFGYYFVKLQLVLVQQAFIQIERILPCVIVVNINNKYCRCIKFESRNRNTAWKLLNYHLKWNEQIWFLIFIIMTLKGFVELSLQRARLLVLHFMQCTWWYAAYIAVVCRDLFRRIFMAWQVQLLNWV